MKFANINVEKKSVWEIAHKKNGPISNLLEKAREAGCDLDPIVPKYSTFQVRFDFEDASAFLSKAIRSALLCEIPGYFLHVETIKTDDRSIVHQMFSLNTKFLRLRPSEAERYLGKTVEISVSNNNMFAQEIFLDEHPILRKMIIGRVSVGTLQGGRNFSVKLRATKGKARDDPVFAAVHTVICNPRMDPSKIMQKDASSFEMGYETFSSEENPLSYLKAAVEIVGKYCQVAATGPWLTEFISPVETNAHVFRTDYRSDIETNLAVYFISRKYPKIDFVSSHIEEGEGAILKVTHPDAKKITADALREAAEEFEKLLKSL